MFRNVNSLAATIAATALLLCSASAYAQAASMRAFSPGTASTTNAATCTLLVQTASTLTGESSTLTTQSRLVVNDYTNNQAGSLLSDGTAYAQMAQQFLTNAFFIDGITAALSPAGVSSIPSDHAQLLYILNGLQSEPVSALEKSTVLSFAQAHPSPLSYFMSLAEQSAPIFASSSTTRTNTAHTLCPNTHTRRNLH
jgi:hypothetical protein